MLCVIMFYMTLFSLKIVKPQIGATDWVCGVFADNI